MPPKRQFNPHTRYGTKKSLSQAREFNRKLSAKQLREGKSLAYLSVFLIYLFLGILLFLIGGWALVKSWLAPKGLR